MPPGNPAENAAGECSTSSKIIIARAVESAGLIRASLAVNRRWWNQVAFRVPAVGRWIIFGLRDDLPSRILHSVATSIILVTDEETHLRPVKKLLQLLLRL